MAPEAAIIPINQKRQQRLGERAERWGASSRSVPLRRAAGDGGWWAYPAAEPIDAHPAGGGLAGDGSGVEPVLVGSYPMLDLRVSGREERTRRPSPAVLRRRRAVVLAAVVVTLLVLLALPLHATGGRTIPAGTGGQGGGATTVLAGSPGASTP